MKSGPERLILLFNSIVKNRIFLFLFFVISLLYLLSYMMIPFHDHDSVIYALRGELIFRGIPIELLPFDHKPLGLNLIYGLFGYLIVYGHGQSLMIAIFFNLLITLVSYKLISPLLGEGGNQNRYILILLTVFLITFQAPFIGLSGNSETLANFFILFSLFCLFNGTKSGNRIYIMGAGVFAVFSISINLLSAVILSLPSMYLLIQYKKNSVKKITIFFVGVFLAMALLILAYINLGDPRSYFSDLYSFYQVYGDRTQEERLKSFLYFFRSLILFVPILISSIFVLKEIHNRLVILVFTLILWIFSAFTACLVSGNDLVHYFSFLVAPFVILSTILFMKLDFQKKVLVFFVPLFFCSTYITTEIYDNFKKYNFFQLIKPDIEKVISIVGDEKLLSLKSGHVPFYLSKIRPNQKYLFPQNANFFQGSNEDSYWKEMLKDYNYVIAPIDLCISNELPLTCLELEKDFNKIFRSSNLELLGPTFVRSFIIYAK